MGGKAFSTGPDALYTPRMVPEVYVAALNRTINSLGKLFPALKSPIEAPEKASFGDIDIIVSLEGATFAEDELNDPYKEAIWAAIKKGIRAERSIQDKNAFSSQSFAVSRPEDISVDVWDRQLALMEEELKAAEAESKDDGKDKNENEPAQIDQFRNSPSFHWFFIQVDVQLAATNEELEWRAFKHDHGDMWNILGTVIRPYGLSATEEGLHIRIPEMEDRDKKKARVLLTISPTEARRFLLDGDTADWTKRFASVDAFFAYAARCKWYSAWLAHERVRLQKQQDTNTKATLKSNDRQRMRTRGVFARWINEHVPAQIRDLPIAETDTTPSRDEIRDAIRESAFETFPSVRARYEAQLADWNKEQNRIFVKNTLIKQDLALPASIDSALPVPQWGTDAAQLERHWRGALRSALVKIIVDDEDPGFEYSEEEQEGNKTEHEKLENNGTAAPKLQSLRDEHGILVLDDVTAWIGANWKRVGRAAWNAMCKQNAERLAKKNEKRRRDMEREMDEQRHRDREAESEKAAAKERLRQRDLEKEVESGLRFG